MTDRLAEIEDHGLEPSGVISTADFNWLIAAVKRLEAALAVQTWCPDCGKVLEIPNPGIAEGMEAAAAAVRASCDNCNRDGHDVHGDECAYCGIPMKAIRMEILK